MVDRAAADERRARIAEIEAQRVAPGELARWFWPWALSGILVAIVLAGLWCASRAVDDGTYAVGLAAAALALASLVWELGAVLGGRLGGGFAAHFLVDGAESLVVLIVLMAVLALGGLMLAARVPSGAASGAGYGLCLFGIVFDFANLKHYFDRREWSQ